MGILCLHPILSPERRQYLMKGKHEIKKNHFKISNVLTRRHFGVIEIMLISIMCFIGTVILYCVASSTVIYPINGQIHCELGAVNISLQTQNQAANSVRRKIKNFTYNIHTLGGTTYEAKLADLMLTYKKDPIARILAKNKLSFLRNSYSVSLFDTLEFNEVKIRQLWDKIQSEETLIPSRDAQVVYEDDIASYVIQPEVQGNELTEDAIEVLKECLKSFMQDIYLLDAGCYKKPSILMTDADLQTELDFYNAYPTAEITYTAGSKSESLTPEQYFCWLSINEDGKIIVDEEQVEYFVDMLSSKYNTYGIERTIKTSTGKNVVLEQGNYGWVINKSEMVSNIIERIKANQTVSSEIVFEQRANQFWSDYGNDIGNSYVEVSLEDQNLWMYVNGELIVDTPVVTGCIRTGHGTPTGVYALSYKTRDTVLRGDGYASPVSYWMPFNGGIGLHDASWRYHFGGTLYKTNGSHGCINIPPSKAKIVYENLSSTMPIIVW